MSSFKLLFAGIGCFFLAALFVVIGVASTSWMVLCFPSDSLNELTPSSQAGGFPGSSAFGGGADTDRFMCIRLGLFKREDEINGYFRVVTLRTDALDTSVQATAALLLIGVLSSFLSVCLLIYTANESIKRKSSRAPTLSPQCHGKLGFVLGVVGSVSIGIGILTYTIAQANTVHNPANFLAQTQNRLGGIVTKHFASPTTESKVPNLPLPDLKNTFNAFENVLDIFSISGVTDQIRGFFTTSDKTDACKAQQPNQPTPEQQSKIIQSLVTSWDPRFGYSFVLSWLGFVLSLAGSILVGLAYFKKNPHPKQPTDEALNSQRNP